MAQTTRSSQAEPNDFLSGLTPEQRRHFFALERALAQPGQGLRWYHGIGQQVNALRTGTDGPRYGAHWMQRLTRALGVSHNRLTKPLAFAQRFTEPTDLDELEQMKVSWTAVVTSMSLPDREEQLALLRESVRQGWPASRLEIEVHRRLGDRRQPRTGRRLRPPAADAPEVELQELLTRARTLGRYLDSRWLEGEGALLPCLRRTPRRQCTDALRDLLTRAGEALGSVAGQLDQLRTGLREVAAHGSRTDGP